MGLFPPDAFWCVQEEDEPNLPALSLRRLSMTSVLPELMQPTPEIFFYLARFSTLGLAPSLAGVDAAAKEDAPFSTGADARLCNSANVRHPIPFGTLYQSASLYHGQHPGHRLFRLFLGPRRHRKPGTRTNEKKDTSFILEQDVFESK